jgi:hypothetical protein
MYGGRHGTTIFNATHMLAHTYPIYPAHLLVVNAPKCKRIPLAQQLLPQLHRLSMRLLLCYDREVPSPGPRHEDLAGLQSESK